jgi:hypothetical protein
MKTFLALGQLFRLEQLIRPSSLGNTSSFVRGFAYGIVRLKPVNLQRSHVDI